MLQGLLNSLLDEAERLNLIADGGISQQVREDMVSQIFIEQRKVLCLLEGGAVGKIQHSSLQKLIKTAEFISDVMYGDAEIEGKPWRKELLDELRDITARTSRIVFSHGAW